MARVMKGSKGGELTKKAYRYVLSRIMTGRLEEGSVIDRTTLASTLNVSLAPIVDAVNQLAAEGFVDIASRRGTIVKKLEKDDVYDQIIIRIALECQVARLCSGEPARLHFPELKELAQSADEDRDDLTAKLDSNMLFHIALVHITRCDQLIRMVEANLQLGHLIALRLLAPKRSRHGICHIDLLREITHKSADDAEKAMRNHLVTGLESVLDLNQI